MSGLDNLKDSLNALTKLYESKKGKQATADELLNFATELQVKDGINLWNIWDESYDADHVKENSISQNKYYADQSNLLFQTSDGKIVAYNVDLGTVKIATNDDLAKMLDKLDDGIQNGSLDAGVIESGQMELTNNFIKLVNSYKLVDKEISSQDKNNSTATVSSKDVKGMLDDMAKATNAVDFKKFITHLKANPADDEVEKFKMIISNYLIGQFGEDSEDLSDPDKGVIPSDTARDLVLKNLTDLDVTTTKSGYIDAIRDTAYNNIVDKLYTEIVNSYQDKSSYKNTAGTEFDIDEIKSINLNFTQEAGQTLTVGQVDAKGTAFINYLKGLGVDVNANDEIKLNPDGSVEIKGFRLDPGVLSKDDTSGKFSISSSDVKTILDQINSGKDEKTAVRDYLTNMFRNDTVTMLSKLLDEDFSSVGQEYLASARDAALSQVIDIVLSKVKSGYQDNAAVANNEVTADVDGYTGLNFTKDDFKDINFNQKLTTSELDKPEFINYINQLAGKTELTKSVISIGADGKTSVDAILTVDKDTKTEDGDQTATVSSADAEALLKAMAEAKGLSGIRDVIARQNDASCTDAFKNIIRDYLLKTFGGSVDEVLKNLTDLDISASESGFVNAARATVLSEIIDKMYTGVIGTYQDKAVYDKDGISFNVDEIKSAKFDFTSEAANKVLTGQIDTSSPDFMKYLQSMGVNVVEGDTITVDATGKISVKGIRIDTATQTKDDTNGSFSISGSDVKGILDAINSGKDQKTAVIEFLAAKFGDDVTAMMSKLLDSEFSSVGANYLQSARDAAYDKFVDAILAKVKSGYVDNAAQAVNEVTYDLDNYNGIKFTKDDFENIDFGQKITEADLDKPEFIKYVNDLTGRTDIAKSNITVGADGKVSINEIVKTNDSTKTADGNKTATLSNTDTEALLKSMAQAEGYSSITDLIANKAELSDKSKDIIEEFVLQNFGGDQDTVLKNLTELDIQPSDSDYVKNARTAAFNQIIGKFYDNVLASFQDKSIQEIEGISFNIDEIKAVNLDFITEASNSLLAGQINTTSADFTNYVKGLGVNVVAEDNIEVDPAVGKVSISGIRIDTTTKTADLADGKFAISGTDVKAILDAINSGKDEKTAVSDFLKTIFGQDISAAMANILDENFSASGAGYLSTTREAAFNKVVDIVLAKVKTGFVNDPAQTVKEVTYDFDNYNGLNFSKADFANISFGQKITTQDLNNPAFIDYVKSKFPSYSSFITKDTIKISDNGEISLNIVTESDTNVTTSCNHNGTINLSTADIQTIKNQLAGVTDTNQQKQIMLRFLADKFGSTGSYNSGGYGSVYNLSARGYGNLDGDTYRKVMNMITNITGTYIANTTLGYVGSGWWETYFLSGDNGHRLDNIDDIVTKALAGIKNNSTSTSNLTAQDGITGSVNTSISIQSLNCQPTHGIHTDPIGFEAEGKRFDFIEDDNQDGKFSGSSEFVGADDGWAGIQKYDLDNDGDIEGSELDKLNVLEKDQTTGEARVVSADDAGIDKIDLTSFKEVNQVDKNDNILAGLFDLFFKKKKVEAEQTFDSQEYLDKKYKDEYGIDIES